MRRIFALACAALLLFLPAATARAVKETSYTYTLDDSGNFMRTQDAYLPDKTVTELGLDKPEDLFFGPDGYLYIADSGNKRVLQYDVKANRVVYEIKHKAFATPRGLFVTKSGDVYVADAGAKAVFRFSKGFELLETFSRPDSPVFADTNYEPKKVAVDNAGGMYIIGEGVYSGVIQLAPTGEFLGYFTVNKTRASFMQMLQKLLFTREQLGNLVDIVPTTFSNVFVDHTGIVYTTTMGSNEGGLKKHNTAGGNMFVDPVYGWENMTDVYVDSQNVIYIANAGGYIDVYSSSGELVFEFGSFVTNLDVSGLFASLPAIAVAPNGDIWAVDGTKGYLQSFTPTDYARTVYSAMGLYEQGRYDASLEKWTQALRLNQMSILAHNGVGKALFHAQRYEEAMVHFEVAGNRKYYSEAFWEVRNESIQLALPFAVGGIAALLMVFSLVRRLDRRHVVRGALRRARAKLMNTKGLGSVLYSLKAARHPLDAYYEIRRKRRGSAAGATVLYALLFILFMLYSTSKGFIYQYQRIEDIDVNALAGGYFLLLGLFIACNYLVSSINDGDGTLKQVYMIPAYACAPLLIAMAVNFGLSYVVTYVESFVLAIVEGTGIAWSVILLFLGIMTVHDYSFREAVRSVILTVVFILIIAILIMILIIMWEQLYQFLGTLWQEVIRNVVE